MPGVPVRRVLITGGAGFIGSNFVRHIRKAHPEDSVVVLDKLTYAGNLENLAGLEGGGAKGRGAPRRGFSFVKGDINDLALVDAIFKKEGIDTVVNFAAESHVDRSILGPKAFIETNINGTFTLLEAARKNWGAPRQGKKGASSRGASGKRRPPQGRFLQMSTDEVYGSSGTGYFTEGTRYEPNSPYAAAKAAADHLVRAWGHTYGLRVVTVNCSNCYGPYQFPEKLIPLMIINALKGERLPIYGDGKNVRDWLYVEDCCRAIAAVLEKGKALESYNIGCRNEKTNIEIVTRICAIIDAMAEKDERFKGGKRSSLIRFVKDRPGHDRRYAIDPTKIERELGWRSVYSFEEALEKTVGWYVENRLWWERIMSGEYLDYYVLQYGGRGCTPGRGAPPTAGK